VFARALMFQVVRVAGLCLAIALLAACREGVVVTVVPTSTSRPVELTQPAATAVIAPATIAPATATTVPATATVAAATAAPPSPTALPPATPTTVAAAARPTSADEARTALGDVIRGWAGVKTFRARIDAPLTPGSTPQTAMQMDVVLPDRMRGTVNVGGQSMEMLFIGESIHMKLPTGQWMKAPGVPMDFSGLDPKRFETNFQREASNVRLTGPDVVDGTPTLVYAYDIAASPANKTGPQAGRIWIGVADRLPRRVEVAGGPGVGTLTITYYDYGAPITIEPPPP